MTEELLLADAKASYFFRRKKPELTSAQAKSRKGRARQTISCLILIKKN